MRIVIVGQTYYPGSNGQAAFSIRLAEGLAQSGNEVMAIVPSDRFATYPATINGVLVQKAAGIKIPVVQRDARVTTLFAWQMQRMLKTFQPDVIHIQDHYPLARTAVREARRLQIPLVGTNHFLPENLLPYLNFVPLKRELVIRLLWNNMLEVYNHVDVATTPTETAAQILRQQPIHFPVYAISCGVDIQRFRPYPEVERSAVRQKFGLHPDRPLFIYVGRLDGEKRIPVLLHALHKLGRQDVQLAIGGEGKMDAPLKALAKQLGLENQVVFTGYIPPADLPHLLYSADIFAMPSTEELQSIATLEAMATAKPILAADARALPELVADGVNGFLFKPNDVDDAARKMGLLLERRAEWESMGQASLARVRPHSLANTVRNYENLYLTLLPAARRIEEKERGRESIPV